MIDRYSRQVLFPGIGEEGQKKLGNSYAVIIGCGILGTIIATSLVRAGVGKIRIVDRDFIEYHNLQRQVLFGEDDIKAELPKAITAAQRLKKVNSSIEIGGVVADVNYTNIEKLITGANLVLDALDNLETRFLINDVALKHSILWIYGAAISFQGMSGVVLPHKTACFRCLVPSPTSGGLALMCDTAGVISPAPFIIGSLQTAEAIKILVGAEKEINRELVMIDVWGNSFHRLKINPRPDCPACQGKYEFLEAKFGMKTIPLCGQNAVQELNARVGRLFLDELATRLRPIAEVSYSAHMLRFKVDDNEIVIFPDGRAILRNSTDESLAKGLYAKYVGT